MTGQWQLRFKDYVNDQRTVVIVPLDAAHPDKVEKLARVAWDTARQNPRVVDGWTFPREPTLVFEADGKWITAHAPD